MTLRVIFLSQRHEDLFLEYLEAGQEAIYHIKKKKKNCSHLPSKE